MKTFERSEKVFKIERMLKKDKNKSSVSDELTLIKNKIFQLLTQAHGKVLTRDETIETALKKVQVNPKSLDVHLSNLRKKNHASA